MAREKQLAVGTEVALYGKLDMYRGKRQLTNPVVDVLGRGGRREDGRHRPDLPPVGKADVSTWEIERAVRRPLDWTGSLADPLVAGPARGAQAAPRPHLVLPAVHQPASDRDWREAQRRLRFDEFLRIQLPLVLRKRAIEAERGGIEHQVDGELIDPLLARRCPTSSPRTSSTRST